MLTLFYGPKFKALNMHFLKLLIFKVHVCLFFSYQINICTFFTIQTVEEVSKSEFGKKGKEFTEELGKTAGKARETLSSAGESLSKSQPMKKVAEVSTDFTGKEYYCNCYNNLMYLQ